MQFDKTKFERLVHYVIWKTDRYDWFGATKLNKVLWFVDARSYILNGNSITGETYVRGPFGPIPRDMESAQKALIAEGAIRIAKQGKLTRFVSLVPAQDTWFSETELQTINWWISEIALNHTATSISEETHDYVWDIAKMGEELPLYAYRVARIQEPTDEDMARFKKRAQDLGLV